jgi:hypothetical protein
VSPRPQHVRIDVDEFDADVRQCLEHRRPECTGTGSEIDDETVCGNVTVEPVHDGRDHPLVVGDERPDRPVVVVGSDAEVPGHPMLARHRPSIRSGRSLDRRTGVRIEHTFL